MVATCCSISSIAASMDEIEQQVATIRGLEPKTKVPRKLLSEEELQEIVTNEFFADYTPEDAASDTQVLSLLGLLPQDFDLLTFYQELYSEQIAGYYDDEAKAMFVVKSAGFTGVGATPTRMSSPMLYKISILISKAN